MQHTPPCLSHSCPGTCGKIHVRLHQFCKCESKKCPTNFPTNECQPCIYGTMCDHGDTCNKPHSSICKHGLNINKCPYYKLWWLQDYYNKQNNHSTIENIYKNEEFKKNSKTDYYRNGDHSRHKVAKLKPASFLNSEKKEYIWYRESPDLKFDDPDDYNNLFRPVVLANNEPNNLSNSEIFLLPKIQTSRHSPNSYDIWNNDVLNNWDKKSNE
jgi:hypothetical protein